RTFRNQPFSLVTGEVCLDPWRRGKFKLCYPSRAYRLSKARAYCAWEWWMSEKPSFEREVRDTVVKSSLTGVAATVLAVTVFSPAGLGGIVGTSMASGFGAD